MDVEIITVVRYLSELQMSLNTIIVQWSNSNEQLHHQNNYNQNMCYYQYRTLLTELK
jgi:hypothetical protein